MADVNTDLRLDGRTAWVTGAGKGLGRAIAVAVSQAGADVAVTARTTADLETLEAELASYGGKVLVLPGSIADPDAVRTTVGRITGATGRLDAVVNCAGVSPHFTRSEYVTDEDWRRVLDINLQGTFYCCREAGKVMLEQGSGSIVNVSSVHASTGFERIAAYAASKGASRRSPRRSPSSGRTGACASTPSLPATSARTSARACWTASGASASCGALPWAGWAASRNWAGRRCSSPLTPPGSSRVRRSPWTVDGRPGESLAGGLVTHPDRGEPPRVPPGRLSSVRLSDDVRHVPAVRLRRAEEVLGDGPHRVDHQRGHEFQ